MIRAALALSIGTCLGAGLASGKQSLVLAAAFIAFTWWFAAAIRKERPRG